MNNNQVLQTLGLASRARLIVTGESLIEDIRKNKVDLVIIANDASDNTKKKIIDKCHYYNVEYILYSDIVSLSSSIGKRNRVAIGLKNKSFASKIKDKIGG